MTVQDLITEFEGMDIALIDQLLKGRFEGKTNLLDVGFGSGRNLFWFQKNGYDVYGIDPNEEAVIKLKERCPLKQQNFQNTKLEELNHPNDHFDIVLCSAVLHFAQNYSHFRSMFAQLVRVLHPNGVVFIRTASDIGLEPKPELSENGIALLPDSSHRFLLTRTLLHEIIREHNLEFAEVLKTVNVNDLRCMTTLVLKKNSKWSE